MEAEARNDLLVMADSDVRVTPEFLASVAAEMSGSGVRAGYLSVSRDRGQKLLVASGSDRPQYGIHRGSAGGANAGRYGFRARTGDRHAQDFISRRSAVSRNCSATWRRIS